MDTIEHLDQAFGGSPFVPTESPLRQNTLVLVQQAKELHLSLRYVSFRWSLGRLAMLSPKESQHLKTVAAIGNDEENLVSFYDAYSNNGIPQSVFNEHLLKLYKAFNELESQLSDDRQFLMGDDISIADVFWSMKMLRLIETDYPFQKLHPRMYQWYQRMYARPAFQNEVMAKNRVMSHLWRSKAAIERIFGFGLSKTLKTLIAA